ncbi:MAG: SsrA-binding protein SmpB [Bacillota bacterium]|jgi:SsrA-binding protein|nr:SsrA-binding protein SmpB [Eubacteriales bacterium]MDD4285618.1 SsrA-binding protein SmpB [Eubacteriales bacterium]MDI9491953.1 SsrA-binding protein SmpB [Bacillota bacterium]NLV70514.1 SsrA-binding protein SmpB [Clostridiales bacterium]HPF18174.1 SsrA-binding protein SmpB [Bacillota bacterium]
MSVLKLLANNKKARHDYFFEELFEAGLVLTGTEIKSVRNGGINLRDSFARIENGEVWVYNMRISPYDMGNRYNTDPLRPKKLLLNRQEIRKFTDATTRKGLTLIPVRAYMNHRGLVKLELAIARGKKLYDKRADIAKRDAERSMDRSARNKERL